MNIALIGYGKMGHVIESIAVSRGHHIVLRITTANRNEMTTASLQAADVAIEFTSPHSAAANVMQCLSAGLSVVCGSTGWNDALPAAQALAAEKEIGFLYASNFSVGVNIFFEINNHLAALMNGHPDYTVTIDETHHTAKKDAPSGTAITLAEQVIDNVARKDHWALNEADNDAAVPIFAHRVEDVPGTHNVKWSSVIDDIEIIHTAHNRNGFALGAVLAAEYIFGKKGVFHMKDVLGIR